MSAERDRNIASYKERFLFYIKVKLFLKQFLLNAIENGADQRWLNRKDFCSGCKTYIDRVFKLQLEITPQPMRLWRLMIESHTCERLVWTRDSKKELFIAAIAYLDSKANHFLKEIDTISR